MYDLEENALPYPKPAILEEEHLSVNTDHGMFVYINNYPMFYIYTPSHGLIYITGSSTHKPSMFLKNVTISQKETEVQVTCEFTNDYPGSSCVLIYREYNDAVLTVIEYPHTTTFPVSVSVDKSKQITFSIFGKNGDQIDSQPAKPMLIMATATTPTPASSSELSLMVCIIIIVVQS